MMERTLGREFDFSDEIFAQEKERIFCRNGSVPAGQRSLPAGGDYLAVDLAGESGPTSA